MSWKHELRTLYPQGRDDWTLSGLWLFLGWLGAHRFYAGAYGTGLLMLLTFGGFGLWWAFDLLMLDKLLARRRGLTFREVAEAKYT